MSETSETSKSVSKKVLSGTLVIVAVSVLAKIVSLIWKSVQANYMGTTYTADAFALVTKIQNIIYPMMSVGIGRVFLPAYKRHVLLKEDEQASRLANRMITMLMLFTSGVIVLLMIFSRTVVSFAVPGFAENEEKLAFCSELVAISAPMYLFIIFADTYSVMLQCHNRFFGSQIREVVSHIPPIICAVLLFNRLGDKMGAKAMAISLILGAVCRLLIELPFNNWKYRYRPDISFRDEEFHHVLRKLPAAMLTAGILQINTLVDTMMASKFPDGAVSSLEYAVSLNHVFSGFLSTAVSIALYPQMVELITLKKRTELSLVVRKIVNIFCVLIIPVTIACVLFSSPLVQVIYERGKFDAASTMQTAGVFKFYCLSLLFTACSSVLTSLFYGHGNTKTPLYITVGVVALNIGLNLLLSRLMGINGLALATSISAFAGIIAKFILVRRYVDIQWRSETGKIGKILLASVVAVIPAFYASNLLKEKCLNVLFSSSFVVSLFHLISAAVVGIGIYLIMMRLLHITELKEIVLLIKKRNPAEDDAQEQTTEQQ